MHVQAVRYLLLSGRACADSQPSAQGSCLLMAVRLVVQPNAHVRVGGRTQRPHVPETHHLPSLRLQRSMMMGVPWLAVMGA